VIVAEPASPFRAGVSAQLARDADLDVAAVGSSDGTVRACASRPPNLVLVALHLPPDGGLATAERITAVAPSVQIVVWSDELDGATAVAAIRAGARGVVDRGITPHSLIRCIKQVAAGQVSLPRHLVGVVLNELQRVERVGRAKVDLAALSPREQEVLALVGEGYKNRAIAVRLGLSEYTVKRHVHNVLTKLAVPSRSAAAGIYGSAHANHQGFAPARPNPPS
jgi:DNA-binding NarL/FixJ family response regulator